MMLSLTPTVPHSSLPSLDWMRTRVFAAVPVADVLVEIEHVLRVVGSEDSGNQLVQAWEIKAPPCSRRDDTL